MGQIDFSKLAEHLKNGEPSEGRGVLGPRVSFFQLRNDGDEAVVRIMHDSPADFDIVAVHPYQVDGKFRSVSCIRDPQDPIEKCPLCAAGEKLQYKFYIHLLVYERDESGNIVASPKVWERPASFTNTIKNLCSEYSPLSDNVFKIKRNGAARSTSTTYDILYANPSIYRPDIYKKTDAFNGYRAIGHAVIEKDYDGLMQLVEGTGNSAAPTMPTVSSAYSAPASAPPQPARTYNANPAVAQAPVSEPTTTAPTQPQQNANAFARPRRFYQ